MQRNLATHSAGRIEDLLLNQEALAEVGRALSLIGTRIEQQLELARKHHLMIRIYLDTELNNVREIHNQIKAIQQRNG